MSLINIKVELQKANKRIAELENQVKVLTFISHPVEHEGYLHNVGLIAKTIINEREKRIAELDQRLKDYVWFQRDEVKGLDENQTGIIDLERFKLEQQAKVLEEMLDVTDTWYIMNTYAITVDDIYEQMQELRKQAAKLKEQGDE